MYQTLSSNIHLQPGCPLYLELKPSKTSSFPTKHNGLSIYIYLHHLFTLNWHVRTILPFTWRDIQLWEGIVSIHHQPDVTPHFWRIPPLSMDNQPAELWITNLQNSETPGCFLYRKHHLKLFVMLWSWISWGYIKKAVQAECRLRIQQLIAANRLTALAYSIRLFSIWIFLF